MGGADKFGDFIAEFCGEIGLFGRILGLEVAVEGRDDVAVNLCIYNFQLGILRHKERMAMYMISPESSVRSVFRVGGQERSPVIQIF